jgi:hypothetical protein
MDEGGGADEEGNPDGGGGHDDRVSADGGASGVGAGSGAVESKNALAAW